MDFLNKALQQITDLFQQMTPAARITAGLLLGAIVCSLVFLFRTQSDSADEHLFGGDSFSQRDLAMMEAAFAKANVIGSKIEGSRMKVPRGKKEAFLKALYDNNAMPDAYTNYIQKSLDKDNPFNATQYRTSALKTAKERELARAVRGVKGIEDANVMYDETMSGSFPRRMERRASVAVKANGNRPLTEEEVRTVRNLVKGAVGNLNSGDITVIDLNAGRSYPGGDGNSVSASDNAYASTKRLFEENYRDKIATQLSMYPGVVVGVNVELDPELSHQTTSLEYKGRPVDVQSNTVEKSTPVILNQQGGGRPGASPNIGNAPQVVNNQTVSPDPATENRTEKRSLNSTEQKLSTKAPLIPNRVSVAIDVPTTCFVQVWKERNPADKNAKDEKKPDPAELKAIEEETKLKIESSVANILPPAPAGQKLVTVTSFTPFAEPVSTGPSAAQTATTWLGSNWQTVAMFLLAVGSMLFLRGMINSAPAEPTSPSSSSTDMSARPALGIAKTDDRDDPSTPETDAKKRTFRKSGPNLRAELTDLVKEDPDTAASILRAWIGDAA